jgi:hypothetical protein
VHYVQDCNNQLILSSAREETDVQYVEFLSKLLGGIQRLDQVAVDEDTPMPGPKYKAYLIERICDVDWSTNLLVPLMSGFKDTVLTSEEMAAIINKVIR